MGPLHYRFMQTGAKTIENRLSSLRAFDSATFYLFFDSFFAFSKFSGLDFGMNFGFWKRQSTSGAKNVRACGANIFALVWIFYYTANSVIFISLEKKEKSGFTTTRLTL